MPDDILITGSGAVRFRVSRFIEAHLSSDSRLDQVSSYNDADFDRLTCKV